MTTPISSANIPQGVFSTKPISDEERLIHQAQSGNLEAFNQLVLKYQDRVFRQALWILKEEEAAEDATQEAFLKAYRKLDSFRGGPFHPWLLRITTNHCLDQLRSPKRRPTQPLNAYDTQGEEFDITWLRDPGETPEQAMERSELSNVILAGIQKLSLGYRLPIILVDLEELNYEDASAVMQIPIGTFKSRLARARGKLSRELQRVM